MKQCQRTEGCQWSSFDERYESCNLFEKCLDVDDCEECTTNHVDCLNLSCDIPGYCEVERYSFAFYELQNIDISFLGICYGFYYDGYNV